MNKYELNDNETTKTTLAIIEAYCKNLKDLNDFCNRFNLELVDYFNSREVYEFLESHNRDNNVDEYYDDEQIEFDCGLSLIDDTMTIKQIVSDERLFDLESFLNDIIDVSNELDVIC